MTIGQAVDRTVNAGIVAAGHLASWLLDRIKPFNEQEARAYLAMSGAEALAEREAETEVFEPGEIAEPVGEYPEVPAQPQTAGQTCITKVAELLADYVMTAFAYDKQLGDLAIDMASEILRAVDRARRK